MGAPMARADVPVSVGTTGALERGTIAAAGPGSENPEFDPIQDPEPGRLSFHFRFPFFQFGDIDQAKNVIPVAATYEGAQAFVPQVEFGEARGLYRLQLGVIAASLGHQTIVRNYTNSPNGFLRQWGFYFRGNLPAGSYEVMLGDIANPLSFFAVRATVKPLVLLHSRAIGEQPIEFDHERMALPLGRWRTGFTFATDLVAPAVDDSLPSSTPFDIGQVAVFGIENTIIGFDDERGHAKLYMDVNGLMRTRGDLIDLDIRNRIRDEPVAAGTHVGLQLRAQASSLVVTTDAEVNFAGQGYVPGYFDHSYEVDRNRLLGLPRSKLIQNAPASWGYRLRGSLALLPYASLFGSLQDQFPLVPSQGTSNARMTVGASASWVFFGLTLSATQSGVENYQLDRVFGEGLFLLAEARLYPPFIDFIQLVGRFFRVNEGLVGGGYQELTGGFVGIEINLSI